MERRAATAAPQDGPEARLDMLVFRIVVIAAALVLGGLVLAYMVTKERRYLAIARQILLWTLAFGVLLGLLYVFERVLLM